jgi:type II secretory pathway component PulL
MKQIGFIDMHSPDALCTPEVIHIFRDSGEYEKAIAFNSPGALEGIESFYVSLPLNTLNFRIMNFPFSDGEKLKKVIPFELENLILESSETVVFDSVILSRDDDHAEALVVYADKNGLRQVLNTLAGNNIDPCVITAIDLRAAINAGQNPHESAFSEAVTRWLINPVALNESDRVALAQQEIINPTINLRTGPFAYTKHAGKIRKKMKLTAGIALALALTVHANILLHAVTNNREIASIRQEIRNTYSGLFPAETRIMDELYQMKSHMKEIRAKSDALIGISPLSLLSDLSKRMDPPITYHDIQIEKGLIKMKAEVPKMDDLTTVKAKLSEFLSDVAISDIKPAANGRVAFTVVAINPGT